MAKVIKFDNNTYLYGTIIEKGSNTYGKYIKYSDGTLIQYDMKTVQDQSINNVYGSGIYQGTRDIVFPIAFVGDTPACQCSCLQWGTGASWGCVYNATLTYMQIRGFDCYQRSSGTDCLISWLAIGRWR